MAKRRARARPDDDWPSMETFTRWCKQNRAGDANLLWPGVKSYLKNHYPASYEKLKDL